MVAVGGAREAVDGLGVPQQAPHAPLRKSCLAAGQLWGPRWWASFQAASQEGDLEDAAVTGPRIHGVLPGVQKHTVQGGWQGDGADKPACSTFLK